MAAAAVPAAAAVAKTITTLLVTMALTSDMDFIRTSSAAEATTAATTTTTTTLPCRYGSYGTIAGMSPGSIKVMEEGCTLICLEDGTVLRSPSSCSKPSCWDPSASFAFCCPACHQGPNCKTPGGEVIDEGETIIENGMSCTCDNLTCGDGCTGPAATCTALPSTTAPTTTTTTTTTTTPAPTTTTTTTTTPAPTTTTTPAPTTTTTPEPTTTTTAPTTTTTTPAPTTTTTPAPTTTTPPEPTTTTTAPTTTTPTPTSAPLRGLALASVVSGNPKVQCRLKSSTALEGLEWVGSYWRSADGCRKCQCQGKDASVQCWNVTCSSSSSSNSSSSSSLLNCPESGRVRINGQCCLQCAIDWKVCPLTLDVYVENNKAVELKNKTRCDCKRKKNWMLLTCFYPSPKRIAEENNIAKKADQLRQKLWKLKLKYAPINYP